MKPPYVIALVAALAAAGCQERPKYETFKKGDPVPEYVETVSWQPGVRQFGYKITFGAPALVKRFKDHTKVVCFLDEKTEDVCLRFFFDTEPGDNVDGLIVNGHPTIVSTEPTYMETKIFKEMTHEK